MRNQELEVVRFGQRHLLKPRRHCQSLVVGDKAPAAGDGYRTWTMIRARCTAEGIRC